jgi:hypothetical protein
MMRAVRGLALFVGLTVLAAAAPAAAAETAAPAVAPQTAAPMPQTAAPPRPFVPTPEMAALIAYEREKKELLVALVMQWLVPGLGSLYAEHPAGAFTTWAALAAGIGVTVWNVDRISRDEPYAAAGIAAGATVILAGLAYGFLDTYHATVGFNRRLRERYHVPEGITLDVGGIRTPEGIAFGPRIGFAF